MAKLTRENAFAILNRCGIFKGANFHALRSDQVSALVECAKEQGYKKPKNANGSTGRYFYSRVVRASSRKD